MTHLRALVCPEINRQETLLMKQRKNTHNASLILHYYTALHGGKIVLRNRFIVKTVDDDDVAVFGRFTKLHDAIEFYNEQN